MENAFHSMLDRQLRRCRIDVDALSAECRAFLHAVHEAYEESDRERLLLERSLELTSQEMAQANTELKDMLHQLRQSQESYRWATLATGQLIYELRTDTGAVTWSGMVESISGYSKEALNQMSAPEKIALVHPDDRETYQKTLRNAMRTQRGFQLEYRLRKGGGEWVNVEDCGLVILQDDGRSLRIIGAIKDITERRRTADELLRYRNHLELLVAERTAELESARLRAEVAGRAKGSFLTRMSHEFRTPLNAILGYLQIFRRRTQDPDTLRGLTIAQQSGEHLLALINNVLNVSSLEDGRLNLQPAETDFPALLNGIIGQAAIGAYSRGVAFKAEIAERIPARLCMDWVRLRQVLRNLLDNALKYTPSGQVTFRLTCREASERRPQDESGPRAELLFEVEDTGVGIARDKLPRLFEPFEQIGISPYWGNGSGLGLAISQGIIRLMGGELSVKSEPGKGSRFWFTITVPYPGGEWVPFTVTPEDSASENLHVPPGGMAIPPEEEICALWGLAQMGDMTALARRAAALKNNHPELEPFAERVMHWAGRFEEQQLLDFIGGFRRKEQS